ncbi:hypothetical protein [Kitasatospora sp. NPDC050543]|uniref:hypothetical protein n=1 Tax=Kitasatospora sp. NPDC050543 TaxID=3364054 RepID=UPI0037B9D798
MSSHPEPDRSLLSWLRGYHPATGRGTNPGAAAGRIDPGAPAGPHALDDADAPDGTDGTDAPDAPDAPTRVFPGGPGVPPAGPVHITAAPARLPSEHEQAAHELALATALVLNAPQASRALDLLVNSDRIHPEGAVVLASLLFITGREDAAQFWWQFAAGSGNGTSAYCLHLYHLHIGETRDAAYWRAQAEFLAANPRPTRARGYRSGRPLLPEDVRRDILSRCHRGLHPRLPTALEAVINRLLVDSDDEDFGEIPQPSHTLAVELTSARTS